MVRRSGGKLEICEKNESISGDITYLVYSCSRAYLSLKLKFINFSTDRQYMYTHLTYGPGLPREVYIQYSTYFTCMHANIHIYIHI